MSIRRFESWIAFFAVTAVLAARVVLLIPVERMWLDEIYTYYGVDHDSFRDFWTSFTSNVNAAPPGYFLLLWIFGKIVPLSPLLLRLFSAVCFAGAFALIWSVARRHSTVFVASVATGIAFLLSDLFLTHAKEARFYGLSLLGIAWAVWTYERLCSEKRVGFGLLLSNALAHALAVSTTYVAGMFSLAILVALVVSDRFRGVWRPLGYLSALAGWIPILFCLPFIRSHSGATSWLEKPGVTQIFHPFSGGIDAGSAYFVLVGFALLFVLGLFGRQSDGGAHREPKQSGHLRFLTLLFLMIPYGVFVLSLLGMPMLIDRYCIPTLIGYALLFVFLLNTAEFAKESAEENPRWFAGARAMICLAIVGGLLTAPLADAISSRLHDSFPPAGANDPDFVRDAALVVTTDPHTYFVRHFEATHDAPFFLVVDRPEKLDRWHRFHPGLDPILLDDLLSRESGFALIAKYSTYDWIEAELEKRSGFVISRELRTDGSKWLQVDRAK